MKKIIKQKMLVLILLIILLTTFIPHCRADDTFNFSDGYPACKLMVFSDKPNVNRGENITFEIYMVTCGEITNNKLEVCTPHYIIDGLIELTKLNQVHDQEGNYLGTKPEIKLFDNMFGMILAKNMFLRMPGSTSMSNFGGLQFGRGTSPIKRSAISFKFTVDENAPSGDHEIQAILFYEYDQQWFFADDRPKIHINYWYEEMFWSILIKSTAFIGLLLTFIILILNIVTFFGDRKSQ